MDPSDPCSPLNPMSPLWVGNNNRNSSGPVFDGGPYFGWIVGGIIVAYLIGFVYFMHKE